MAKRVQVVLNRDVSKLGKHGDLVEVAPGYARNYLLPQGIAVPASPGVLRQVEQRRELERKQKLEERQQAESRKVALETIGRFVIRKQAGEENAIFGAVTERDVVAAIKEATNQDIERYGITLPEIKTLGFYKVQVKLHSEVPAAEIEIQVAPL
jgi:large subunit ribosomal protein L9